MGTIRWKWSSWRAIRSNSANNTCICARRTSCRFGLNSRCVVDTMNCLCGWDLRANLPITATLQRFNIWKSRNNGYLNSLSTEEKKLNSWELLPWCLAENSPRNGIRSNRINVACRISHNRPPVSPFASCTMTSHSPSHENIL